MILKYKSKYINTDFGNIIIIQILAVSVNFYFQIIIFIHDVNLESTVLL